MSPRRPQEGGAISGIRQRFENIVDRHYGSLFGYVRFLTGGSTDAEDIVQQTFLLAHGRLAAGELIDEEADKWLRGAARNLVRAWWRDRRGIPEKLARHLTRLAEKADDPHAAVVRAELAVALRQCLGKLDPDDRRLVSKRYEENLHVTRIAEELRRNVTTLYVRLHRIRKGLKRCVETILSNGGAP